MAASLQQMSISGINLDTRLEAKQITESLLVLLFVHKFFGDKSTSDITGSGWSARPVASAMIHPLRFHRFCALMRFDVLEHSYKLEILYCALFFSKVVRSYTEHSFRKHDYRRLFFDAPRAAMLALLLLVVPMVMIHMNPALVSALGLVTALVFAGLLGFTIHTLGSLQYDREHKDLLVQEHLRVLRQQKMELQAVNKNLEVMICVKEDFLRIASHDLKNSPKAIRMAVGMLNDESSKASLQSVQPQMIEIISRNTTHLQNLIEDILVIQGMEVGHFKPSQEALDCEGLVCRAINLNQDYALGKGIDLILDVQEEASSSIVDPRRVSQVLQDLIGNAVKFCATGDRMTTCCRPTDEFIRVEICDSGPGLTEENMNHVFTKHSRLSGKPTGTEPIMALVSISANNLSSSMGGRISVRNNEDRCATFWSEIPRMQPNSRRG